MTATDLTQVRLWHQQIARPRFKSAGEVVSALGAIQAQDFGGAKWSIALRMADVTEKDIDAAIARKEIVRTWPMRGTLHFVAAADARWMLALMATRIIERSEKRRLELELTPKLMGKIEALFIKALQGGRQMTREALWEVLKKERIAMSPERSYHIFWKHAQSGLICFGAHDGKQATFALLDEWVPGAKKMEREVALAEVALRYFTGHGPATLHDFIWWTGLKAAEARMAVELVEKELSQEVVEGKMYWMSPKLPKTHTALASAYLLPGFDEYLLGYTDRSAALDSRYAQRVCPGSNGVFSNTVVIDGRVVGTWKRIVKKGEVSVVPVGFKPLSKTQKKILVEPAGRYGRYLGLKARVAG